MEHEARDGAKWVEAVSLRITHKEQTVNILMSPKGQMFMEYLGDKKYKHRCMPFEQFAKALFMDLE